MTTLETAARSAPRRTTPALVAWFGLLAIVMAAGFAAWLYQYNDGLQVTGMRDNVMWGLYIVCFMFFVGLSAGGLIVASAGRLFGVDRFGPIVRLAVLEATVAIITAAALILPDLGHPERLLNLVLHAQITSPMIWDITIIVVYLILSLLYVWLYTLRDHRLLVLHPLAVLLDQRLRHVLPQAAERDGRARVARGAGEDLEELGVDGHRADASRSGSGLQNFAPIEARNELSPFLRVSGNGLLL